MPNRGAVAFGQPQARDALGRTVATPAAAVEASKSVVIAAIDRGLNLEQAIREAGIGWGTLYDWKQTDERIAAAIERKEGIRKLTLVNHLDNVIDNPDQYDNALRRPGYANLMMFRTKALLPEYRDNYLTLNVNTGQQIVCSQDTFDEAVARVKAGRQAEIGPAAESGSTPRSKRGRRKYPPTPAE